MFGHGVAGNQIFQGLRRLNIPEANWQTDVLNRWNGKELLILIETYNQNLNMNIVNPSDFIYRMEIIFELKHFR